MGSRIHCENIHKHRAALPRARCGPGGTVDQAQQQAQQLAQQNQDQRQTWKGFGDGFTQAIEMALIPALLALLGLVLDRWIGIVPVLTVTFAVFGAAGTFARAYYTYVAHMEQQSESRPWINQRSSVKQ
jgi:hypothetical protein